MLTVQGRRIAACALLVMLVATPSAAQAFSKAIWGPAYRNGVNQFPLYRQLGVSIDEAALNWNQIAPGKPQHPQDPGDPAYHWPASVDQLITLAGQYHMRVMLQIIGGPSWANGGHSDPAWAPKDPSTLAAFAKAASKRYPSVHLWMVWGEPTRSPNFKPIVPATPGQRLNQAQKTAPHLYARLLDAAYGALKGVNKRNLVIGGCTYTTGDIDTYQWIRNLRLPNGRPPRMDMYAHNPFSFRVPSFSGAASAFGEVQFSDLKRLAAVIDHNLRRGLPLFLSEFTIPTHADQEFNFWVDAGVAGQWVRDALRLSRAWHRIYALGWIHVYDDPPLSYGGLLTSKGIPKPTFRAFAHG